LDFSYHYAHSFQHFYFCFWDHEPSENLHRFLLLLCSDSWTISIFSFCLEYPTTWSGNLCVDLLAWWCSHSWTISISFCVKDAIWAYRRKSFDFKGESTVLSFSLKNSHFRTFSFEGVDAQIHGPIDIYLWISKEKVRFYHFL
jgi:hypothetical protein